MKKSKRDQLTLDLFGELPPAPVTTPGGLSCRAEIAHAMSDLAVAYKFVRYPAEIAHAMSDELKNHDRFDIASKMSKLLGREISKHMLDAYTAESREDHIPPLDTAIAFDLATETSALADLFARKVGAKLVHGKEALDAKLGQLERMRDEAAKQIKAIKKAMGEEL